MLLYEFNLSGGMSMQSIKIVSLHFSYDDKNEVLSNINFDAQGPQSIGIIGANGVGKSTLLKLLVGLHTCHHGTITINNLPLIKNNLKAIREKIGYVFQDSNHQLFMPTVFEDVAFGPRNYGYSPEEVHFYVSHALQKVHMESFKDKPIYQLSGGQKKLVSIATILSMNPNIILLDEPSSALDPRNRKYLINILNDMHVLKIIASHDLDLIHDTCDRTLLLSNGTIVADGPTGEILCNEMLLKNNGLELPLRLQ